MRRIDPETARAAVMGGLVFGAGGGGLERGLRAATTVCELGQPLLATLDELTNDDGIVVTTGVGAPGIGRRLVWPKDNLRVVELLREAYSGPGRVAGIMVSHPGAFMVGTWLPAALDPGLVVADCAANGRGHPTVAMGGMGLTGRAGARVIQTGAGGSVEEGTYLEIVARGTMAATANMLHHASTMAGGAIAACRGPFTVRFCREAGAVGAIGACIRLGEAMLDAADKGAEAMTAAILDTLGGHELGRGRVATHDLEMVHNWEVGRIAVGADGAILDVTVCNEFMAVTRDSARLATFPDLIVLLSPRDGMPRAAAHVAAGDDVIVAVVPRAGVALGAGVRDAAVYAEVERMTGTELASYALTGAGQEQQP